MQLSPIVLFVYNRPEHTRKTLEALSKNILANESDLFIFADGPKENVANEILSKIEETRLVLREKQWCKSVTIKESSVNKGLASSIISGVTEIVNKYGTVIVLEDDLITSPYFLQYMNDALRIYQNTENVACIHGFMYQHKTKLPETFFIKGADCWGWATWSRAWEHFNPDAQYLLDKIKQKGVAKHFNFNNTYDYTGLLQLQIDGKISSWAIRWLASAYLDDMYCLYPSQSLVINAGFDGSGTHCGNNSGINLTFLSNKPVNLIWQNPIECKKAWNTFVKNFKPKVSIKSLFINQISRYLPVRIKQLIKLLFRNLRKLRLINFKLSFQNINNHFLHKTLYKKQNQPKYRFDIVVFNYKHLSSFCDNFSKILNFDPSEDRVTIVSSSATKTEKQQFFTFCKTNDIINYRYLSRKNYGMVEKSRLDFYTGKIGGKENFNSFCIMNMQEHYFDTLSPWSIWGKELNYQIKGDVIPNNCIFDLNIIFDYFAQKNVSLAFCDRNNPMYFEIANRRFIAPNGGNFFFKTRNLTDNKVNSLLNLKNLLFLRKTCDNSYSWALFMEYMWGELFFSEYNKSYDIKRDKIFEEYHREDFYSATEDYYSLRNKYLGL